MTKQTTKSQVDELLGEINDNLKTKALTGSSWVLAIAMLLIVAGVFALVFIGIIAFIGLIIAVCAALIVPYLIELLIRSICTWFVKK